MDDRDRAGLVRMGVAFGRTPVCIPSRMPDADVAGKRRLVNRVTQIVELADGAPDFHLGRAIERGDAGGIVTAIFEPSEAAEENWSCFARTDVTDYSAHRCNDFTTMSRMNLHPDFATRLLSAIAAFRACFGMASVAPVPVGGPAGFLALRMMRHDQGAVLDVAHDGGAGGDIDVVADSDRRDQLRIATDHAAIADAGFVLVVAVVIHGDDAAADIRLAANDSVAEIAQMARLGATPETRFFSLDEITDAVVALQFGAGAEVR